MRRSCLALVCTVVCWTSAQGQSAAEKQETIATLRGLQTPAGGFLPAKPDPANGNPRVPSLPATSAALRALKYFGGEPARKEECRKFVHACFDQSSGGFLDHPQVPGRASVATTAIGLMAVVELKMPVEPYMAPAVKFLGENVRTFEDIRIAAAGLEAVGQRPTQADAWLKEIADMSNPDGTFGKGPGSARLTASAVVALLRLGGTVNNAGLISKTIRDGQRKDGGFGKEDPETSDLETTYRVLRALRMLKEQPADRERCRAFVAACRHADGGYGLAPGKPSSASATYFASIILHWLQEK